MTGHQNAPEKDTSLGSKLKKGIAWQYLQTIFVTIFNFGAGIVLARLLDPVDFGVFAAVTAIANMLLLQVNFGWPATLLRAKTLYEPLLSTVFWLMQAAAIVLMVIVLFSVPFLGRFYEDTRFAPVMILLCLQFFIVPFNTINGSILRWKMHYALVSRISMLVVVISSSCGIFLAYKGFGVYSLVISGILSSVLLTAIMAIYAPWKPIFRFSLAEVKPHFDFTWRLHLNNSLNMLAGRIDNMMIGKLLGIMPLGIYVKAFSLGRMPVDLLGSKLYQMFFTALSHVRENQADSLLLFQKMCGTLTFVIYLPLVILFHISEGFVTNLYGEKWADAVLPMQIMIIGSFATVISMTCGVFCDAQNLVKRETKVQCLNVLLTITAVVIGSKWGLVGVASGIAINAFILLVLMKNILSKGLNLNWHDLWKPVWPNVCASLAGILSASTLIYLLENSYMPTDLVQMLFISMAAFIGYGLTWFFLAIKLKDHPELQTLLDSSKSVLKIFRNRK
ncbi:MAG: lipopolysaccharide biosynthesis protein [Desulfobacter postgatei]|uniref:lipopolysaccharide biosynthesis protein n=1 Tax=Desulfobacter postgatei TaxID=2293 RepID=UPI0023F06D93|nr:lipopolysaccharide biosynthesis protein [Desulfobacter postgatei]MDD4274566.1 lipopolysaccharide biosynthesis protein [Desulfobacter postgatei]